jgi:hypothetical protein
MRNEEPLSSRLQSPASKALIIEVAKSSQALQCCESTVLRLEHHHGARRRSHYSPLLFHGFSRFFVTGGSEGLVAVCTLADGVPLMTFSTYT